MSEAPAGEDGREEADQRKAEVGGVNTSAPGAEGKRESVDTTASAEGSTQEQTGQDAKAPQASQPPQPQPPQPQPPHQQTVVTEDPIEKAEAERNQVKRHVEASPQGRYLRFEDKLGTGQYKVVYRSYDTSMGIEVAWNTVNIKNLPKDEKKRIMNEVRLLQNLTHKNLVQFHGSWVNREREEVIFVTEIMQSGSLMDFIRKVEMIRWRVVKRWARQILRGMHYLHSQDPPIIHRDLKCDNIFINGAAGDIRIGDLGLSTSNTRSEKTMSVLGTPEFMAPELYEEFYTEKVDIYAFGMCMLEMVTKERPYSECVNAAQIYRKVTSQILPSALDRVKNVRARDFIRCCLSPDPDKRPSAMGLLNLPFLKDKNEEEDNTLVELEDPVEGVAGQAPASVAGAPLAAPGVGVNTPAKIDPTLPGVLHPAHRGTPGLDTIDETMNPSAPAPQVGAGGVPQQAATAAAASQGQIAGSTVATVGLGDGGGGGNPVVSGDSNGDAAEPSRRPSYAAALMSEPMSGEGSGEVGDGTAQETGSSEQGGDAKGVEGTAALPEAASADAPAPGAQEVQQSGGRKISRNPRFESDDDEDEQENDMSHPEGFLMAMPEDESSMRVLELPDGRVQRREEEDEEEEEKAAGAAAAAAAAAATTTTAVSGSTTASTAATESAAATAPVPATATAPVTATAPAAATAPSSGDSPASRPEIAAPVLTAPSSAQAPPLSSGVPPPSAPAVEAPRPPIANPAVPPTADPAVFYSAGGGHRPNVSGGVITTEVNFPTIGGGNDPAAAAAANGDMLSDPGVFGSLSVGPAVGLQRARSFSPREHTPEVALSSVASMPPPAIPAPKAPAPSVPQPAIPAPVIPTPVVPGPAIPGPVTPMTPLISTSAVPAPTFPAPPAPAPSGGSVQFVEKQHPRADGVQPLDVLGVGIEDGPALLPPQPMGTGEGEKQAPSDQELQDMLSGRTAGSTARCQTEIKIANLQGPEQEIMRLVMHTHIEGRLQEVEFDFNLDHDHPKQVSAEMIRELGLSDEELGDISLTITNLAEKARRRRVRRTSSNSSGLVGQIYDGSAGQTLPWTGSDANIGVGAHRGTQSVGCPAPFGSGGGDGPISGNSEATDNDNGVGNLAVGVDEYWSDDDLGIEDDDEFQKKKAVHDKKKRQAEKVYEARLAALLAARNDRKDEHKRAQERYKKDCEDFDKKVEKLKSEKEKRMEECFDELRGLEDGYRQKHRDAKQAKRHSSASAGAIAAQVGMLSVGQPPLEAAPTPQGYAQRQAMMQGQIKKQIQAQATMEAIGVQDNGQGQALMDQSRPRNADVEVLVEDQQRQPINLSQFNSTEGQGLGNHWSGNPHEVVKNSPTLEEEAKRDVATL